MNFPCFPQFRRIVPEDRDEYLRYYKAVEPYSDFSFNNLLIWLDIYNDLEISRHKRTLILRFTNVFESEHKAYTILGTKDCLETAEVIFDFLAARNEKPILTMVPECALNDMLMRDSLPQNLTIKVNIDHRDYVFDVASGITMPGGQYARLRQSMNVFKRNVAPRITIQQLDLGNQEITHHLLRRVECWKEGDDFADNDPMRNELDALRRYFALNAWAPANCLGFFMNGELIGFSIYQYPSQPGWAIINHIKCAREPRDLFDFIWHSTFIELDKKGTHSVNGEQDLGIVGLRTHKLKQRPARFLYRYDISRL